MKLNKLGTITSICGVILVGIGTLYGMDKLPVTGSALAASETRQAMRDDNQDKLFLLSEIRTLNGEISNVKYDLQTDPMNKDWQVKLSELELELELMRDELNNLRNE